MSRGDVFLWVVVPYVCLTVFVVGHAWRWRHDRYGWTARSTQLLEHRLLQPGSLLFHFGLLAVIGGHVLGILVPKAVTAFVGIDERAYHLIAATAGLAAGAAMTAGFAVLLVRRFGVARVRLTTQRSDLVLLPLLTLAIATGMAATIYGAALGGYDYRATVSPWFRGLLLFDPNAGRIADAPFVYRFHVLTTFVLFAAWPFTRLVHAWSVPLAYIGRSPVLYRSRRAGFRPTGRSRAHSRSAPSTRSP